MSKLTEKYMIVEGFLIIKADTKIYVYEPVLADKGKYSLCCNFKEDPKIFDDIVAAGKYILDLNHVWAEHRK